MTKRANGEGMLRQRSDGRWEARLSVDGNARAFYGKTQREVRAKLDEAKRTIQDGLPLPAGRETVEQYLARFLEAVKPGVRPRTYEAYALNVRRLTPHIGRRQLAKLSPGDVQHCYAALLEGGLSRRSVEQAHAVLHLALKLALQQGEMARNPTEAVTVPRPAHREMKTLATEQLHALFAATTGDRLHALWVVLGTAGLRVGEVLGLRWDDIDLDGKRLVVRRALQRQRGTGFVLVEPKSARSRRTVLLSDFAVSAAREHRRRQAAEILAAGPLWEDRERARVFTRPNGMYMEAARVREALARALRKAGLPDVRVHDLRHGVASMLLEEGKSVKLVADMLGHSTVVLTLDTYSHVTPAMHADAAATMDRLFGAAGG